MTFNNTWKPIEEAAKLLNCKAEELEILINGFPQVAVMKGGGKLVNLDGIEDFMKKVQAIVQKISPSPKEDIIWIKGRIAAQKMNVPYSTFVDWCGKGILPARKKATGWRVEEGKLNQFISSHQELIQARQNSSASLKPGAAPKPPAPPRGKDPPRTIEEILNDGPTEDFTDRKGGSEKKLEPRPVDNDVPEEDGVGDEPSEPGEEQHQPVNDPKFYTIRVRKCNGGEACRIDEVAQSIHISENQIRGWIRAGEIKAKEVTEHAKITWYINKENLKTFLEKYNIIVTFESIH